MKKYIVALMLGLGLFPTMSYAKCCDCCQDKYFIYTPTLFGTTTTLNSTGIEKLIGKMVHRTKPHRNGLDESYMGEPRKLLAVTDKYLILSSEILKSGQFEIERDTWDDGNWEEVKPQRVTVTEMIGGGLFHFLWGINSTKYSCVRCGKQLACCSGDFNYYCTSCKTGFNIKEE